MPSLGTAYVTIRGDLRGLQSDLNKALDMVKGFETKTDASGKAFAQNFSSALNKAESAVKGLQRETTVSANRMALDFSRVHTAMSGIGKTVDGIQGSVRNLTGILAALAGGYGLQALGKSLMETAVFIDRTEKALQGLTGTNKAAAQSMAFVRAESERLGLVFRDQLEGFMQLTAAANGTKLQGETIKYIWSGLSTAVTALQLDSERAGNSIYALVQMMSKGVITSEELKRQLGDNIPGATTIAARAMGVTTEELNKMLKAGTLLADVFLPKLALEFYRTYGEAAVVSSQSAQAAINRLKNAYVDLVREFSNSGILKEFAVVLGEITKGVHDWIDANEQLLQQDMKAYIADAKALLTNVVEIGSSVKTAWDAIPSEVKEIGLVGLVLYGAAMHPILASLGMVMAAVGAVIKAGENPSVADASGQIERYNEKLTRLQNELAETWRSMDATPASDKSRLTTYAEQAEELKQGIIDTRNEIEKLATSVNSRVASELSKFAKPSTTGLAGFELPGAVFSSRQVQDKLAIKERSDALGVYNKVLGEGLQITEQYLGVIQSWREEVVQRALVEQAIKNEREAGLKLSEEEIAAAKKKEDSIIKYIEGLEKELALIGLDEVAKERLTAQEKGLTGARLEGAYAIIAQINASKAAWKAADEANDAIAKNIADGEAMAMKARADEIKAAEAQAEKTAKAAKAALEKRYKEEERYLERVQDATADTFYDIFKNTEEGFQGLFDRIGDYFLKMLAEWAAQAIARPIIVPVVQSLTGAMGLAGAGGTGGSGSGTAGLAQIAGNTLWNNYMGNTTVGGYVSGAMSTPLWTNSGQVLMQEGLSGGYTGTSMIGSGGQYTLGNALTAYGVGSLGYQYLGGAVGLPQGGASSYGAGLGAVGGQMAGSALASGALAGTAYGSWAGPVGMLVGAALGGILGSFVDIGGDGNRHMTLQSSPELSYGGALNFNAGNTSQYDYTQYRTEPGRNKYYGQAFGALEDSTNAAAKAVFDAVDEMLAKMPEDVAASIKGDLAAATFTFNEDRKWVIASDNFEGHLNKILEGFVEDLYGQITPYIEKGLADYAQELVTSGTQGELFKRLSEKNIMKTSLTESGLFNADFSKKEDVSFEDYMKGVDEWLTTMGQLEGVFNAIDTTVERILDPLSAFESGMEEINNQFNSLKSTLYQVGAATAEFEALEEKRLEALQNYKDKTAEGIEDKLLSVIQKDALSEKDYATRQVQDKYLPVFEQIAELGPEYEYLRDMAQEAYRIEIQGIMQVKDAAEDLLDVTDQLAKFRAFQLGLNGYSDQDVRMEQIGKKYGWGEDFGTVGNWDLKSIYEKGITPLLEMSFEDFKALAEDVGVPWEELAEDATFVSDAFKGLGENVDNSTAAFESLSESLRDQILKMRTSTDNQADVYERLGIQKGAISDMLGGQSISGYLGSLGSNAEKADAISKLQELFGGELSIAQEAYQRPSHAYQGEYTTVLEGLNSLLEYSDLMKSEYQLQYEQTDYLAQIAANTALLSKYPEAAMEEAAKSPDSLKRIIDVTKVPTFADGGWSGDGGLALLHPNEMILNPDQQRGLFNLPVTTQNDSGATVYITINANGGNSDEVADKVLTKLNQSLPTMIRKGGPVRVAVQDVSRGR